MYGHQKMKMMNGGRAKWTKEGRPLVRDVPSTPRAHYRAKDPDPNIRAFRDKVLAQSESGRPLIDVRSVKEYTGELIAMPNYPQEGAQRGGHIPGAVSIPWSTAVREEDGTFKPVDELKQI